MKPDIWLRHVGKGLKRASPTICAIAAVGGVIVTAVLSSKAALKADKKIKDEEEKRGKKLSIGQKAAIAAPTYIPTAAATVLTSLAIIESDLLNKKQQLAIAAAYAALQQKFDKYRSLVPEEQDKEITDRLSGNMELGPRYGVDDGLSLEDPNCTYMFHDEFTGKFYARALADIFDAERSVIELYNRFGSVSLNEWCSLVGIDESEDGDILMLTKPMARLYNGIEDLTFEHIEMRSDDPDVPTYIWIRPCFPFAVGF